MHHPLRRRHLRRLLILRKQPGFEASLKAFTNFKDTGFFFRRTVLDLIQQTDDSKRGNGRSQEAFAPFNTFKRMIYSFDATCFPLSSKLGSWRKETPALSLFTNFKKQVSSFKYTFAYILKRRLLYSRKKLFFYSKIILRAYMYWENRCFLPRRARLGISIKSKTTRLLNNLEALFLSA